MDLIFNKKNTETVNFSQLPNSGDWLAKNPPDGITLTGSSRFKIALFDGDEWIADNALWNPQNCSHTFTFGDTNPKLELRNAANVPIPSSAFLFGAGVIGLVGFRRLRR